MIKKLMNPVTLGTILNSAPMIIQGAGKLINLIKQQKEETPGEDKTKTEPVTTDNLAEVIGRLEARLDATDETNIEQVKLIEQLARQNEALAGSLQQARQRSAFAFILALVAILVAVLGLAVT